VLRHYRLKLLINRAMCEISQNNFITNFVSSSVNPFNFEIVQFLKAVFYSRKARCKRNFTDEENSN